MVGDGNENTHIDLYSFFVSCIDTIYGLSKWKRKHKHTISLLASRERAFIGGIVMCACDTNSCVC